MTSTVTVTPATTSANNTTAAPGSAHEPAPQSAKACTEDQLEVTNAPIESADTSRRVVVTFGNTSSRECTLTGYPGADLVTPAGGVRINIARRPANAAHHLRLAPNDAASADVQSSTVDSTTGSACPTLRNTTAPNAFQPRTLRVDPPICDATVSSVD